MQIGIVGAGILGRLLAFACVEKGMHVTLFDQQKAAEVTNCSMAAAGLLAPLSELDRAPLLIYHLGLESIQQHWPAILKRLSPSIYFQAQGSLMVAHPNDQQALQQYLSAIQYQLGKEIGFQKLDRSELLAYEKELTQFDNGYFFPQEGNIDAQAVMHALQNYLEKKLVWHHEVFVTSLTPFQICIAQQYFYFDLVIDCRGLGAKLHWRQLQGVRGELISVYASAVNINHPIRLIHPRYALYVVPRPESHYLIGATEIYSEDYSEVSVKSALELLSMAYYLHPGFAEGRITKLISHCRPTLLDHLPRIQYTQGLIVVNGLYRHGFLIAPALVADILRIIHQCHQQECITFSHYPTLWERANVCFS